MGQKTGFRTFELYLATQYASINGRQDVKISETFSYLRGKELILKVEKNPPRVEKNTPRV